MFGQSIALRVPYVGFLAALAVAFPGVAYARGPSTTGAINAVIRAVAEEGGNVVYYGTPQVRCRHTTPSHFGCSFFNLTRQLGGRVSVVWSHGHYYVGEPRYEAPPEYIPLPKPCDITPGGC
jgi:hypothetical protein